MEPKIGEKEVAIYEQRITISRQYGSGGRELGKAGSAFGIPFYDKELVGMIAREGKIETAVLERLTTRWSRIWTLFAAGRAAGHHQIAMTQKLYAAQCRVILDLAARVPA